jgi:superfamily II DNA/RNA helicase
VFSQFADTVDYLEEKLVEAGLPFLPTLRKSFSDKQGIIKAISMPKRTSVDDYKILVATDAISEGYNLSRAGAIFNYDIPTTPRASSHGWEYQFASTVKCSTNYIYNYFPPNCKPKREHFKFRR